MEFSSYSWMNGNQFDYAKNEKFSSKNIYCFGIS